MDVTVVVVSYNSRELTLECLRSVYDQTRELAFGVLVLDNASTDGSAEAIAREFPQARLIALEENLGFAAANNLAAESAAGELLLLLNPDTVVLNGAAQGLVSFAQRRPEAGIWGGVTVFGDGSPNPTFCWGRPNLWSTACRSFRLAALLPRNRLANPEGIRFWSAEEEADIISGFFFLVWRDLWERLGGFDPEFFMYGEEADFCLRARAQGFAPRFTRGATVVHHGGASERVRSEKQIRGHGAKTRLMRRHWSPIAAPLGVFLLAAGALTRALCYSLVSAALPGRLADSAESWRPVWKQRARWIPAGR